MREPSMILPQKRENLYMNKFHQKFSSNNTSTSTAETFNPNPLTIVKKKLPSEPKNHKDIRDCSSVLSGAELQKVKVGNTIIDFGVIFVKSHMTQTFWVRNDN